MNKKNKLLKKELLGLSLILMTLNGCSVQKEDTRTGADVPIYKTVNAGIDTMTGADISIQKIMHKY